jgi:hypothetical protein
LLNIKSAISDIKSVMIKFTMLLVLMFIHTAPLFSQDRVEVSPVVPYDRFITYETLTVLWIAIIGLIIIIKMKLRELERIQQMGIYKEEKDIPALD